MSTKLINNSQVKNALKIKGFAGSLIAGAAMRITGFNRINRIYSHISDYKGIDFANSLISHLNIQCCYNPADLEYIPKTGPFIVVSNHPFGAIDGIIMLSLIGKIRPDIKVLTNFLLSYIPNLEEEFFPVNPFTSNPGLKSSFAGLKMAMEHLQSGGVLGLFPSGEVSSNNNKERVVKDIEWQKSIIKLIQNAEVPVVPIFFSGQNSALFHFLGKIHPMLRTVRLPHELSNKKNKNIIIKIGSPVNVAAIKEYDSVKSLGDYLYNRTYALEGEINYDDYPPQLSLRNIIKASKNIVSNGKNAILEDTSCQQIDQPVAKEILQQEITAIEDCRLFTVRKYYCYLADIERIPNLIKEIGIRREMAFRAVGEGTGKSIDLDNYDTYYKHLILWDSEENALVGAYRLGIGSEIIEKYGRKGFYSNSLFRYKPAFKFQLAKSLELGRSFVSLEYQKDPLALMLLIKGIFYTVIRYKDLRYLLGPVSISSSYPIFYRSLMVYYLKTAHSAPQYSSMITPRCPFKPNYYKVNPQSLLQHKTTSLEKFDRFLLKLSDGQYRMPTLLKKYLKINARIVDYNVDPDFNYCIDGLIMLTLNEVPHSEIDALSKEFSNKEEIYKRFDISF
ncbi:MAG: lysophospholipid acyltransferase family protein [Bacteroidales bacterium]|nr:lysophospholipid acyltransferase family protein [Bacteroidales bacterium]